MQVDLHLQGQVVVIVGGAGYIGSAITQRFRDEGATAVVASRHGLNGPDSLVMDAHNPDSIQSGVEEVLAKHGRIDALVVTAAPRAQTMDPAKSADPDQVLKAVDRKAVVFLRVAAAVIPVMREAGYGRIVAVSGQNAFMTGSIAGSMRNAATILIAKNLADELAGSGVTVTSVSPGIVDDEPASEVHVGRPGDTSPQQIADLVAFLASPLSGVSGESIAVGHRIRGITSY